MTFEIVPRETPAFFAMSLIVTRPSELWLLFFIYRFVVDWGRADQQL
jgi:hypothetical protein